MSQMDLPLDSHLQLPPPEPPPVAPIGVGGSTSETLLVVLLIGLIVISVVGNTLVCVAIFTDRRLRKLGNAFIVSLAIADLFVSCLVMTFALVNDLMNYWIFGDWFCDVWISFDIMCCTASILNLCAISLDRFIHIKDCLLYNQWMTKRVALGAVVIIWFISGLVSFVPITLGWHKPDYFTSSPAATAPPFLFPIPVASSDGPVSASSTMVPFAATSQALERHQVGRVARNRREVGAQSADPLQIEPQFKVHLNRQSMGDKLNYNYPAAGSSVQAGARGPEVAPEDPSFASSIFSTVKLIGGAKLALAPTWFPRSQLEGATSGSDRIGRVQLAGGQTRLRVEDERANKRPARASGRQIGGQTDFVTTSRSPSPSLFPSNLLVAFVESTSAEWKRRRRRRWSLEQQENSENVLAGEQQQQSNQVEFNPQDGFPIGPDPTSGPPRVSHLTETGEAEGATTATVTATASDMSLSAASSRVHPKLLAVAASNNDQLAVSTTPLQPAAATLVRGNDTNFSEGAGQARAAPLPQCMLTLTPTYAIISSTISFYIPCLIMLGLYTKLFACARKHVRNIQAISKAPMPIVSSQPPTASDSASPDRQVASATGNGNQCDLERKGWRVAAAPRTWIRFGSRRLKSNEGLDNMTTRSLNQQDAQPNNDNRPTGNDLLPTSLSPSRQPQTESDGHLGLEAQTGGCNLAAGSALNEAPATSGHSSVGGEPNESDALLVESQQCKLSRHATSFTSQKSNSSFRLQGSNKHQVQQQQQRQQQQQQQQQSGQLATHKAAVTLGIIMGSFLFCWVPFFCLNITKAVCVDCIPSSVFRFFTWLGYANSALNPIIYGIHNTEFRDAFNRIFFKHLNIKSSRHYLNRRFSYDLRHASHRTGSRKSCSQQASFNPMTNIAVPDDGNNNNNNNNNNTTTTAGSNNTSNRSIQQTARLSPIEPQHQHQLEQTRQQGQQANQTANFHNQPSVVVSVQTIGSVT